MQIVDAQVHLYAPSTPERPWAVPTPPPHHRQEPILPDEFLRIMDEGGVDAAVIVPPEWEGKRNDLALEAARQYPKRYAVMGRIHMERPESRGLMADWRRQPGMLGMRLTFTSERQRPWLTDGTADWVWPAAEKAGVPLMIYAAGSLPLIDGIAEKHPGLRLVIDHMAVPSGTKDAAAFAHLPDLLRLARHPNVGVKVSGLPGYSSEPYPFRPVHDAIRRAYDAFGPQRCFWGTDWTRMPCPYREAIALFTEELPWLPEADKEWIMGRAICEWLGWERG